MSATATVGGQSRSPVQLACSEVWGGNRAIDTTVRLPGVTGRLVSQPSRGKTGGDVHYLSVCGSGLLSRICIADVVGHGSGVAAVSSAMHRHLRACVNRTNQARVLRGLNRRLAALGTDLFTTAAMLTYFPPTGRLSVSYAGHEPAWFFDAREDRWGRLEVPAPRGLFDVPLAVEDEVRYSRRRVRVRPGDRLLLVTDGVLEAPSPSGVRFGTDGLERLLNDGARVPCDALAPAVLGALREHTGNHALDHDDVTVLALEFVNNVPKPAVLHALRNRLAQLPLVFRKRGGRHRAVRSTPSWAAGGDG